MNPERIMRGWQQRLRLNHWEILFQPEGGRFEPDATDWDDAKNAYIWRSRDYYMAELWLNPKYDGDTDLRLLNILLVHELLHLVTRDCEFILDQLDGLLHRDTDNLVSDGHRHALEGAVDFLAYRFVDLCGPLTGEEPWVATEN